MTGYVKTTTDNQFVEYPYGAHELQRDNPEANYDYFCDFASIFPDTPAATRDGFALSPVVIDADPTGHTSQLHSPLYAHEVAKRCDCPCGLHASMGRCGYRGECVQSIVLALQLPVQAAKGLPAVGHLEAAIGVGGSREPAGLDAKYFDRTPLAHVQHSPKGRFGAVDNQPARTRHNTHQMMELPLDSRNIREDVSMIELKIVQDRGFGAIVDKLGALVEKCRVIFVSFDHEKRGVCVPRRYGEIAGYATDQEPWLQPSLF